MILDRYKQYIYYIKNSVETFVYDTKLLFTDSDLIHVRILIIKVKRSHDSLIFIMGISILGKMGLILKRVPDISCDVNQKAHPDGNQ